MVEAFNGSEVPLRIRHIQKNLPYPQISTLHFVHITKIVQAYGNREKNVI